MFHYRTKATHTTLTPALSEYLDKRLGGLEKLIDPEDTSTKCDVEIGKISEHHQSGEVFRAEINLHTGGRNYRAVAVAENLNEAIDKAQTEMKRELRRSKRKRRHLLKRGGVKMKTLTQNVGDFFARKRKKR